jgi:drug/metabolite transporter (DMT)-like permease
MLAAFLWALYGPLAYYLSEVDSLFIIASRGAIALPVFIAFAGKKLRFTLPNFLLAMSYIGIGFTMFLATKYTSPPNVGFIQFTAPLFVLLFSASFLGEKPTKPEIVFTIIAFFGTMIIFLQGLTISMSELPGNLIAMGSALCFAAYILLSRKYKETGSAIQGMVIGSIVLIPLIIRPGIIVSLSGKEILALLILGIFQTGLGYAFYIKGINKVRATQAGLYSKLEPVFILLLCIPYALPSWNTVLGGIIVITAITLNEVSLDNNNFWLTHKNRSKQ